MALTHNAVLDFAITALSIYNGVLLLWLGLTVFLNAQRRTWGIWIAAIGLLSGSGFFMLHTMVLGIYPDIFGMERGYWWQMAWVLVILLPLAWYIDILWYTGFTEKKILIDDRLLRARKIHQYGLRLLFGMLIIMALVVFFATPMKQIQNIKTLNILYFLSFEGTHAFIWIYALFIIFCMALSIYALRLPVPSGRLMGDEARRRALPYLFGATIFLFFVTVVVIFMFLWVESEIRYPGFWGVRINTIAYFDILLNFLIMTCVFLIGQAVCSYEVYTGETLPRRGLMRYWNRTIFLGAGFSAVAALFLIFHIRTVYIVIFVAVLIISFFAILTWRLFIERETFMRQLRPFVTSQRLYQQAIQGHMIQSKGLLIQATDDQALSTFFDHLCQEILMTNKALLVGSIRMLPIHNFNLVYPDVTSFDEAVISKLNYQSMELDDQELIHAVQYDFVRDIHWMVSLWGEMGRIGTLFLGSKLDNSLYTLEEIEIARSACERLLDTKASIQMTKHLMDLQREQLVQSQLLDQRSRRLLHDELLPDLHALMIELSASKSGKANTDEIITSLQGIHKRLSDLLHAIPDSFSPEISRYTLIDALKKLPEVNDHDCFAKVKWEISDLANKTIEGLPIQVREILYFAAREVIRNASNHGGGATDHDRHELELQINVGNHLGISIKDFGCGVDVDHYVDRISAGGGKGLMIHQTMMSIIGGSMMIESVPGQFTKVILQLPLDHLSQTKPIP
jgi:signal transduction histidine kinase